MQISELNKGLIFHAPLDEWSGTQDIVSKIIGVNTDAYPVIGKNGSGRRWYNFNGTSDYVALPTIPAFGTSDFSIVMKIKTGSSLTGDIFLLSGVAGCFGFYTSGGYLKSIHLGVLGNSISTTLLVVNTDYIVTYIKTGGYGYYNVNGIAAGSTVDENNYIYPVSIIGINSSQTLNGSISMCCIFNYALSAQQVINYSKPEYPIEWIDRGATGAELVVNGSFTGSATGWGLGAGYSYGDNNLVHTGSPSFSVQTLSSNVINKYVLIKHTIVSAPAGGTNIFTGDSGSSTALRTSAGNYADKMLWNGVNMNLVLYLSNEVTIDNVSAVQLGCILDLNAEGMSNSYWYDKTNSLTATVSGATLQIPSASNLGATYFNGTSGNIATNIPAFGTGDFTLAFSMLFNTTSRQFVVSGDTGALAIATATSVLLVGNVNIADVGNFSSESIAANTWVNLAYARENGVGKLYVNGLYLGQITDTQNYYSPIICIGKRYATNAEFVSGILDNIYAWGKALDADTIKLLNDIN